MEGAVDSTGTESTPWKTHVPEGGALSHSDRGGRSGSGRNPSRMRQPRMELHRQPSLGTAPVSHAAVASRGTDSIRCHATKVPIAPKSELVSRISSAAGSPHSGRASGVEDVLLGEQGINGGIWEVQLSTSRRASSGGLDDQLPVEL